jgi:hypothetical protein
MAGNVLTKARSLVIHGLAAVMAIATYALGSVGAQVVTTLGVSSLALTTTTTPANAQWGWRRAYWRRGWGWRRGYWRRGRDWGGGGFD